MNRGRAPRPHLGYGMNMHPGESAAEAWAAVCGPACAVREQVSPGEPMGLALRLGADAAETLDAQPELRGAWKRGMTERGLYAFTINGFPYGRFHGARVKEQVYAPDWRDPRRRRYTMQLARALAEWLPEGVDGSISSVPVSYAAWMRTAEDRRAAFAELANTAAELAALERETGRLVRLALEPEPGCVLQRMDDLTPGWRELRDAGARAGADAAVARHIGLCLDTCHAAVAGERPADWMDRCAREGIPLVKIQISAAVEAPAGPDGRAALERFRNAVYLHQVRALDAAGRVRGEWADVDEAPAHSDAAADGVWRAHVHVPLFWTGDPPLRSTADTMDERFWSRVRDGACAHLETETYTLDVLPGGLRCSPVDCAARELQWVRARLAPQP
ncbi:MAG: metabolite traffic protein EboE [Kiritimatiellae bacterium]|nr:metabolite traffic protein EboE [Kiritimatiellia bacterium]